MRWIAHRLIVAGACCLPLAGPGVAGDAAGPEAAADFALKSLAGKNFRLSEFRGEIVVLSFWASWCGRCREQLPILERLQAHYAGRPLRVLSVSLDRRADEARATAAGLDIPVLLDSDRELVRRYDPKRLPQTVLVDPAGRVRGVFEGYRDGDMANYQTAIDQLFAEEAWLVAGTGAQ